MRPHTHTKRFPKAISEENILAGVAEETGIHIGDGSMSIYRYANRSSNHEWKICGDSREDAPYLYGYVIPLTKMLYGVTPSSISSRYPRRSLTVRFNSKKFVQAQNPWPASGTQKQE